MKYQIRQKIRFIRDDEPFEKGEIATITKVEWDGYRGSIPFMAKVDDREGWVTEGCFELLETSKQPFKVGDKVKVIECYGCDDCIDKIGSITGEKSGGYYCDFESYEPDHNKWYKADELEKVEAKEEKDVYTHTFGFPYNDMFMPKLLHPNCTMDFAIEPRRKRKGGGYMSQLSKLAKKLLDPDTKALVKAGVLDNELEVTDEGADFVLTFLVEKNKVELAKEARKQLREQKKEEDEE